MNMSSQHRINCRTPEGTVVTRTVRRRPFPMTAAYALQTTDHKGQTYTDIATPPKYRLVVCSRRTDSVCRWLVFQSICCALAKLRMVNNQAGTSRQHIASNVVAPVGRINGMACIAHRILPRRQPQDHNEHSACLQRGYLLPSVCPLLLTVTQTVPSQRCQRKTAKPQPYRPGKARYADRRDSDDG